MGAVRRRSRKCVGGALPRAGGHRQRCASCGVRGLHRSPDRRSRRRRHAGAGPTTRVLPPGAERRAGERPEPSAHRFRHRVRADTRRRGLRISRHRSSGDIRTGDRPNHRSADVLRRQTALSSRRTARHAGPAIRCLPRLRQCGHLRSESHPRSHAVASWSHTVLGTGRRRRRRVDRQGAACTQHHHRRGGRADVDDRGGRRQGPELLPRLVDRRGDAAHHGRGRRRVVVPYPSPTTTRRGCESPRAQRRPRPAARRSPDHSGGGGCRTPRGSAAPRCPDGQRSRPGRQPTGTASRHQRRVARPPGGTRARSGQLEQSAGTSGARTQMDPARRRSGRDVRLPRRR